MLRVLCVLICLSGGLASAFADAPAILAQTAAPAEIGSGLRAEYFEGVDLTGARMVARIDPVINFATPFPDLPRQENFSARWTGAVKPKFSETYTFTTTSDDGIRLWVNGQLIIENWTSHGAIDNTGDITLEANRKYSIKLEYFQGGGPCAIRLDWQSAHQPRETVPSAALFPPLFPEGHIAYQDTAALSKSTITIIAASGDTRRIASTGGVWKPALSPDGTRVAYTSGAFVSWTDPKIARNTEVFMLDLRATTSVPRRLTEESLEDEQPAFSPDSRQIVFATRRDGYWALYLMTPSVSKIKRITINKLLHAAPAFSADGETIYFQTNRDGQWEIYRLDVASGEETRLTDKGGRNPTCSPDGKWIAFTATGEGGRSQLFLMKPDGSEVKQLTTDAFENDNPCFSPDSTCLLYQSKRDGGKTDLYLFTLATGGITAFTNTGTAQSPSWSR